MLEPKYKILRECAFDRTSIIILAKEYIILLDYIASVSFRIKSFKAPFDHILLIMKDLSSLKLLYSTCKTSSEQITTETRDLLRWRNVMAFQCIESDTFSSQIAYLVTGILVHQERTTGQVFVCMQLVFVVRSLITVLVLS